NERIRVKILSRFCQTICATGMVIPGHNSGPTEPPNGIGDSLIIGRDQNPTHKPRLLDTAVDQFYQRLSFNYAQYFSGETNGTKSGGDDRYGGLDLHQNTALDLSTMLRVSAGPLWQKSCTRYGRRFLVEIKKKGELNELHSLRTPQYNGATLRGSRRLPRGDQG